MVLWLVFGSRQDNGAHHAPNGAHMPCTSLDPRREDRAGLVTAISAS